MAKKSNSIISPWILFAAGTILFTSGWLMKSFPLLIFVGIAPFFAIVDQGKEDDKRGKKVVYDQGGQAVFDHGDLVYEQDKEVVSDNGEKGLYDYAENGLFDYGEEGLYG